jgi:hypothetical protein
VIVSSPQPAAAWKFIHFGLIVTGEGEEAFLPTLFRSLTETGRCTFKVLRRIGQRSPITAENRKLKMVGTGRTITDKDATQIGLEARKFLMQKDTFVILVDDLEGSRAGQQQAVFQRYRQVLDTMLGPHKNRASVHFLVNMLEAYYFADSRAINAVLGTTLADHTDDVETIGHPKGDLKRLFHGFDEIEHGRDILARLDVAHVLSRVDTCASLRTLFGWCWKAIGETPTDLYQLVGGVYHPVTRPQIDTL